MKVSHINLTKFPLSSFYFELLIAIELSNKNVSLNNLNLILSDLLDKYASIKRKFINPSKLNSKWFNDDTIILKKEMRRCERRFLKKSDKYKCSGFYRFLLFFHIIMSENCINFLILY